RKLLVIFEGPEFRLVVKILAIRRSNNARRVGALVSLGSWRGLRFCDLHARSAIHVVHPNLIGFDRPDGFRDEYVFPIGSPARRSEAAIGVFRNLLHA